MKCEEAAEMILSGVRSKELEEHLSMCSACAALEKDYRELCVESKPETMPEVPENLDLAIRFAARKNMPAKRSFLMFRIGAAAAAVLLLTLHFAVKEELPAETAVPVIAENTVSAEIFGAALEEEKEYLAFTQEIEKALDVYSFNDPSSYDLYAWNY